MSTDIFKTQWGWIGLAATSRGVRALVLPKRTKDAVVNELSRLLKKSPSPPPKRFSSPPHGTPSQHLDAARTAIRAYLAGKQRTPELSLDLEGYPLFRKGVWQVLRTIPYGQTRSYGWVARKLGRPKSARAVGQACGANPFPLVIPCHRVVAGNGSLGGFSGGLPVKRRLLDLEGCRL
jgi:methylated-DNA-[protein]-cysteine S-methyltransferase